jgi:hypothetical protein
MTFALTAGTHHYNVSLVFDNMFEGIHEFSSVYMHTYMVHLSLKCGMHGYGTTVL